MKSYKNSDMIPNVGDIVMSADQRDGYWTSRPEGIEANQKYEVVEVFNYIKSYGVTVKPIVNKGNTYETRCSATNFSLFERAETASVSKDKPWMIIQKGNVIDTFETEEKAKAAATKIIQSDYKKTVIIAERKFKAKAKLAPVDFS